MVGPSFVDLCFGDIGTLARLLCGAVGQGDGLGVGFNGVVKGQGVGFIWGVVGAVGVGGRGRGIGAGVSQGQATSHMPSFPLFINFLASRRR